MDSKKIYKFNNNNFDEIISLGSNCKISERLKRYNLKKYTYLFDWMWSSISFIIKFFEKKEFEYCDVSKLNFIWERKSRHTYISNNECKEQKEKICTALSVHDATDFTKDTINEEIPNINERYQRRYNRLLELLNSNKSVLFVRLVKPLSQGAIEKSKETADDYIDLHNIIKNNYNINFFILIIDEDKIIDQTQLKNYNFIYSQNCAILKKIQII